MRIACPSCSAAYDVPDSLVTGGRVVRCARCGGEWVPIAAPQPETPPAVPPNPAQDDSATDVAAAVRPSAMDRLAARTAPPRPSVLLRLAWAGSLALLVLAAGAAIAWRGQIVAAWPPSARAYALLGLRP